MLNDQQSVYWNVYFDMISNEQILSEESTCLVQLKKNLHYNPSTIVDIGCGQSEIVISLLQTGHNLVAIDTDERQIDWLKERVKRVGAIKAKLRYMITEFNSDQFESDSIDAIVVSNLLHFFTEEQCQQMVEGFYGVLKPDGVVIIVAHEKSSPYNKGVQDYFKRFYNRQEIMQSFPKPQWTLEECITESREPDIYQRKIVKEWIRRLTPDHSQRERAEILRNHYKENPYNVSVTAVCRKLVNINI